MKPVAWHIKEFYSSYPRLAYGLTSVAVFVASWELLLTYVIPYDPLFFTQPSRIAAAFINLAVKGKIWSDLAISMRAFTIGFGLAVGVGIPIGAIMGWWRRAEYTLDPFLTILYASPIVAIAPLLIILFGVGLTGKVVLVFLLAVFPFIFNTFAGVKSTDQLLINVVKSFGGRERDLVLKVVLPSTLPYIIAGARFAIGRGIIGVIVGEFYAASEGIGFAISQFGDTYRIPEMFASILILSAIAVALTEGVRKIENRLSAWRAS